MSAAQNGGIARSPDDGYRSLYNGHILHGKQLVKPEREWRDQLCVHARFLDARPLEVGDHDVPPPVLLGVQERIAERERHLVPELGVADGVSVDQHVGHGRDSNRGGARGASARMSE